MGEKLIDDSVASLATELRPSRLVERCLRNSVQSEKVLNSTPSFSCFFVKGCNSYRFAHRSRIVRAIVRVSQMSHHKFTHTQTCVGRPAVKPAHAVCAAQQSCCWHRQKKRRSDVGKRHGDAEAQLQIACLK